MPSKPAAPFYMPTSGTCSFKFLYILVIFVIVFWIIAIQWVWSGILLWLWFSFPCWLIMVNTFSCAYCLLVYLFFFENHLYPLLIFLKLWEYLNVYWSFKFPLLWISVTCIVLCCSLALQFSSVAQLCLTLCDPMNRSTPGLPVLHQLPEFTQTHVHRVGDAIQPSHPLLSPSPPAPNPSQHQGLFQWVNSSHEVAKLLEFQLQHQSFQWTPRTDLH